MGVLASEITSNLTACATDYSDYQTKQKKSKLHITGPLLGESTSDQWIPFTKGQKYEKRFHVMNSSNNGGLVQRFYEPYWNHACFALNHRGRE